MSTNIFFVRHGKADNKLGIFYGRLPRMKLAKKGEEQIYESANFLKMQGINKVYSSNMLRARQSAKIISKVLSKKHSKSNLVTEIHSFMEGKPFEFGKASSFDHYFSPLRKPGNESMEDISKRMLLFVNKISKKYPNQNIAVVSHGDPLMILKASILKLPMQLDSIRPGKDLYIKYGEILLVQVDGNSINVRGVFTPSQAD